MEEEWRPVVGWEGVYEVSSAGRLRGVPRTVLGIDGRQIKLRGKVLKPRQDRRKYHRYVLRSSGQLHNVLVHRLVAEAFIPNPDNLPFVLHWDDNPENNHVSNLRWGTSQQNARDSIRNGNHSQSRKTQCARGHPFNESNTYYNKTSGSRACRTCLRESAKRRYDERKEDKNDNRPH